MKNYEMYEMVFGFPVQDKDHCPKPCPNAYGPKRECEGCKCNNFWNQEYDKGNIKNSLVSFKATLDETRQIIENFKSNEAKFASKRLADEASDMEFIQLVAKHGGKL